MNKLKAEVLRADAKILLDAANIAKTHAFGALEDDLVYIAQVLYEEADKIDDILGGLP